jgi:iron complex transport system ATP-binding protein
VSALLRAEGLEVAVAGRALCRGLELSLEVGQCWGILGANGAGKTTLLHTLAGLRPAERGSIHLQEKPLETYSRRQIALQLGLLVQDSSDPFPASVLETALIGRHPHLSPWQLEGAEETARARGALAEVGLEGMENRQVATLSGGERRRLAMATLLTQDPGLLLLDEPTNHLDLHQQIRLLELLGRLAATGKGVLMVLHDLNLAARYCDHLLLLYGDGTWDGGETAAMLDEARLSRLYGHPIRRLETAQGTAYLPA